MRRDQAMSEERRGLTRAEAAYQVREDPSVGPRFVGHAAVFDQRTAIGNPLTFGFYEQVAAGAFTKTLSEGDARMLIDHDPFYVVSRVSAESLHLAQDRVGLAVDSALDPELSYVRDLTANLRNGNVTGMSFGFFVVKDDWAAETVETSDGQSAEVEVRTIQEVKLVEVSAVTFPAYDSTDAGLRSMLLAALRSRADRDAVARRADLRPEWFGQLLEELPAAPTVIDLGARSEPIVDVTGQQPVEDNEPHPEAPDMDVRGEPGESTRGDTPDTDSEGGEPGESTPSVEPSVGERMRALAARYNLPL